MIELLREQIEFTEMILDGTSCRHVSRAYYERERGKLLKELLEHQLKEFNIN